MGIQSIMHRNRVAHAVRRDLKVGAYKYLYPETLVCAGGNDE